MSAADCPNPLLMVSLPCTGGSNWQQFHLTTPHARKRVKEHTRKFLKLLAAADKVAEKVSANAGTVVFELPRSNAYWQRKELQQFCAKYGLKPAFFDGCAFGLVSSEGVPIKKPWTFMSDSPDAVEALVVENALVLMNI